MRKKRKKTHEGDHVLMIGNFQTTVWRQKNHPRNYIFNLNRLSFSWSTSVQFTLFLSLIIPVS